MILFVMPPLVPRPSTLPQLELRVLKKLPPGTGKVEPIRAFALHHLVVGGFKDPRAVRGRNAVGGKECSGGEE